MPQASYGARPLPAAALLWTILLLAVSGLLLFGIPLTLPIADASVDHVSLLSPVSIRLRRNPAVFVNGRLRQSASLVAEALHGGSCAVFVGWLFLRLYRARGQPGLRLGLGAGWGGLPSQLARQVATTAALLFTEVWQACVDSWRALRPATSTRAAAPSPPLALEQRQQQGQHTAAATGLGPNPWTPPPPPPAFQSAALAEPLGPQPLSRLLSAAKETATSVPATAPLAAAATSPAEAATQLHRHRNVSTDCDVLYGLQQQQQQHTYRAGAPSAAVEPPADPWVTGAGAAPAAVWARGLTERAAEASDGTEAADQPDRSRPRPLAGYRPFSTRGAGSGPARINPALLSLDARLSVTAARGDHGGDAVHTPPPYLPRAQLISTHIKIHGAEPEDIPTGYQNRIAEVLTLSGLHLDGVYVQKGCIDLRVDAFTFDFGFAGGHSGEAAAARFGPAADKTAQPAAAAAGNRATAAAAEWQPSGNGRPAPRINIAAIVRALQLPRTMDELQITAWDNSPVPPPQQFLSGPAGRLCRRLPVPPAPPSPPPPPARPAKAPLLLDAIRKDVSPQLDVMPVGAAAARRALHPTPGGGRGLAGAVERRGVLLSVGNEARRAPPPGTE